MKTQTLEEVIMEQANTPTPKQDRESCCRIADFLHVPRGLYTLSPAQLACRIRTMTKRWAIRRLAAAALVLLFSGLFCGLAHGGAANIAATIPGGIASIRFLVGTSPAVYSRTSIFAVPFSANSQVVTNLLTNLVAGVTNYIAGQVVGTNNVLSDISTNLLQTVPGQPSDIQTVPLSVIFRFGSQIQVSRDFEHWPERFLVEALPEAGFGRLTYHTLPDQPNLFFRGQATPPPIPGARK